jgi:hypothetical protein
MPAESTLCGARNRGVSGHRSRSLYGLRWQNDLVLYQTKSFDTDTGTVK